jgi:hypothetical protein
MPFATHIVIFSDDRKQVPEGTELVVGLPTENPRSLSFAHKRLFADRQDDFDLFIYTEDDILITEEHIRAFLQLSPTLHTGEIPGFLLKEIAADGSLNYPQAHVQFLGPKLCGPQRKRDLCVFHERTRSKLHAHAWPTSASGCVGRVFGSTI